ncbi:hypothetical protein GCM10025868_26760 [Angustibacter aerolatus]|uniref:Uncharacterized protein n=1 Tax=Angustibacter aerolatus TaxID=1162965 RepID=A0ABQ6JKU8_9ACTN|nr:hypothetical protein GCM10025868_26760 [Angustibacter aerolatus]
MSPLAQEPDADEFEVEAAEPETAGTETEDDLDQEGIDYRLRSARTVRLDCRDNLEPTESECV